MRSSCRSSCFLLFSKLNGRIVLNHPANATVRFLMSDCLLNSHNFDISKLEATAELLRRIESWVKGITSEEMDNLCSTNVQICIIAIEKKSSCRFMLK